MYSLLKIIRQTLPDKITLALKETINIKRIISRDMTLVKINIDNRIIVLAEHQSIINENMLRQGMCFRVVRLAIYRLFLVYSVYNAIPS